MGLGMGPVSYLPAPPFLHHPHHHSGLLGVKTWDSSARTPFDDGRDAQVCLWYGVVVLVPNLVADGMELWEGCLMYGVRSADCGLLYPPNVTLTPTTPLGTYLPTYLP